MATQSQQRLEDLDPLFATKPGTSLPADASTDNDVSDLHDLDPIFAAPLVTSGSAVEPKKTTTVLGKEVNLEDKALYGGAGAIAGPIVQKGLEKLLPGKEARTLEGAKNISNQMKIERVQRELAEQELIKRGIKPADMQPSSQSGGTKWAKNWAGMEKEAASVPEAAQAYQRTKMQGKVGSQMQKKFGSSPAIPGQPRQSAVDRLLGQSVEAETAAANTANATRQAEQAAATKLQQATPSALGNAARMITKPLMGALGGAGAAMDFKEAYDRYTKGDTTGAVIAALGGVSGLAMLFPGGQIPGAIGQGLTIGAQYLHDRPDEPVTSP